MPFRFSHLHREASTSSLLLALKIQHEGLHCLFVLPGVCNSYTRVIISPPAPPCSGVWMEIGWEKGAKENTDWPQDVPGKWIFFFLLAPYVGFLPYDCLFFQEVELSKIFSIIQGFQFWLIEALLSLLGINVRSWTWVQENNCTITRWGKPGSAESSESLGVSVVNRPNMSQRHGATAKKLMWPSTV